MNNLNFSLAKELHQEARKNLFSLLDLASNPLPGAWRIAKSSEIYPSNSSTQHPDPLTRILHLSNDEYQVADLCLDYCMRASLEDEALLRVAEIRQSLSYNRCIPVDLMADLSSSLKLAQDRYKEQYQQAQDSKQPSNIIASIRLHIQLIDQILQRL